MNKWWQLNINNAEDCAALSEQLENTGAIAVTLQDAAMDPIFEPEIDTHPLWHNTKIQALFDNEQVLQQSIKQLSDSINYTVEILEDQDWVRNSQQHFQAMCFGENLWVCPSWTTPPDPDGIILHLDPGVAFGTGTHDTTAMCLTWLSKQKLTGKTIIDYGCGSGILAIAAILLGAKQAWGVDIDPQAIKATLDNAQANNINDSQLIAKLPPLPTDIDADILLANILAKPLLESVILFNNALKAGGQLVLSGIISEQEQQIKQAYAPYFKFTQQHQQKEWLCLIGEKF